jgi:hypothetical protein
MNVYYCWADAALARYESSGWERLNGVVDVTEEAGRRWVDVLEWLYWSRH